MRSPGDKDDGHRCPKRKINLLNGIKVRDREHVDDGDDEGAATFDAKKG